MNLSDISIHAFLAEHRIKNEKGDPIDFRDHPFLFDIYRDDSPNLVVLKAAQVGMSTCEVIRILWLAAKRKMDIIYTLPTDEDVRIFVGGKVNRIIAQNAIFKELVKDKDSVETKAVGLSQIYFRGTWSPKAAIMVTSDFLVHDEKDSSRQDVVDAYEARLQHSKHKWKHVFSHPSVPGHGVDVEWALSDQKYWFVPCGVCGKEQFLEWPDSVDPVKKTFACKFCRAELGDRRKGRWVQKYKNRKWSGYLVNLLMCPWVTAAEILDKHERMPAEFFHNKVLGLPYEGDDNTMPRHVLQRCVTQEANPMGNVVIGSDSGLWKHWVAGNSKGIFAHGKTGDWADVEALLRRFPRSVAILDALPDLTAPRDLRAKYPGRVYLGNFTLDRKTMQIARWGKGKEEGSLLIDRHRSIQQLVDEFHQGKIRLNGEAAYWEAYMDHWQNIYRVKELDSMERPVFLWKKKNTEDHWVMATTLFRVGLARFGSREGKNLRPSADSFFPVSQALTPEGTMRSPNPREHFIFPGAERDWRD